MCCQSQLPHLHRISSGKRRYISALRALVAIKPTLTLVIFTAMVMACSAYGSSAIELGETTSCEDFLDRRSNAHKWLSIAARYVSIGSPITEATKDIAQYCR